MTEAEKLELAKGIHEQLAALEREVEQLTQWVKPVAPDRAIGRLTRMEAIQSKSINEANLGKAKQKIRLLQRALTQIDEDDFGICARCERPIPFKRILLMPQSRFCVRCAGRR